jgi:NTP pyrophosphatase (non-canonical NTP hydrolase)
MKKLIENVINWAESKGIYEKSTALSQRLYAIGELTNEFRDAIAKNKTPKEIKTELGDVLVFYINYLHMSGKSARHIVELFRKACDEYSHRANGDIDSHVGSAVDSSKNPPWFSAHLATVALGIDSTLEECLQLAYDKISKRNGQMQNGKLVKEGDCGRDKWVARGIELGKREERKRLQKELRKLLGIGED